MAATPPRIKSLLGAIKETYLDDETAARSPHRLFEGLVKMELVLRGVLVLDDSKLWQQVSLSVGKPLLEESSKPLPPPLAAGANVMAGRVAEALAAVSNSESKVSVDPAILQRTNDIADERWKILLTQEAPPLQLAKEYFTQAAWIQKETPPMWKKVWDTWALLSRNDGDGDGDNDGGSDSDSDSDNESTTPFEAQTALEHLIRIAMTKGNVKRAAELQVRLVLCYLNPHRRAAFNSPMAKAFGGPATLELLPKDAMTLVQSAQSVFTEMLTNQKELSGEDQRLLPVLQLRIDLAREEAQLETVAQEQHKQNQNRSVASSSLERCRSTSRTKVFQQTNDSAENSAILLKDLIVTTWTSPKDGSVGANAEDTKQYWRPSLKWAIKCIERLRDRALAHTLPSGSKNGDSVRQSRAWKQVLDYVSPLLVALQEQTRWNLQIERKHRVQDLATWLGSSSQYDRSLVSLLATTLPKIYWMLLSKGSVEPMEENLKFVLDILSALILHGAPQEAQRSTAAVGSKDSESSGQNRQWKLARSLVVCEIAQDNPMIVEQVSREAVATKKQEHAYLGYLQCMVAWSGWYQRPWSYCSNLSDVRRILNAAQQKGERGLGSMETLLLKLARADAELLKGGFPQQSETLYAQVLDELQASMDESPNTLVARILQSHCYNGMARASQIQDFASTSVDELVEKSLEMLDGLSIPDDISPLHIWNGRSVFLSAVAHQRSVGRQLIADSLISQGKSEQARSFLEAAVRDAPMDSDAALAFGAFLLRMAFYMNNERLSDAIKAAQIQLLKAAKMDASKADPFALLGLWFEEQEDSDRAQGCFSKSLGLDPCNPIAGRGLLRLQMREHIQESLDTAINVNSPLGGWAWRAVGLNKIFLEAEDDFAVVALLKSLRSRDIAAPGNESLGIFYRPPSAGYTNERADALAELAMCYRRLGRFTASIRAFHAAIESAGEYVSSSVLCSCAQVELDLSLFDDAAEKFSVVLLRQEDSSHAIAAYGQGVALYSIAQRNLEDGKVGSAMSHIQAAVESCENVSVAFGCSRKLLGDLYSFGASLPPNAFAGARDAIDDSESLLKTQLEFVCRGESAYRSVSDVLKDDSPAMKASVKCDVGSNILLQAQLYSNHYQGSKKLKIAAQVEDLHERSVQEFHGALELDPMYFPAWCGLGCATLAKDPMLAQHAFSRCLQIQQMFPDAYANIGFLYTSKRAFGPSESVMNALTQIADTPMMWMNRAFALEKGASDHLANANASKAASNLSQAADAYRAALQVTKHPDSQLGLATTGRIFSDSSLRIDAGSIRLESRRRKESTSLIKEYRGASVRLQESANLMDGFMTVEQAADVADADWCEDSFILGEARIAKASHDVELCAKFRFESIQDAVEVPSSDNKEQGTFLCTTSLQRQILHDPGNPNLWLSLAKELISSTAGPESSRGAIKSSIIAADRAANMLTQQLAYPKHVNGECVSDIKAGTLSEALALVHWLKSHEQSIAVKEEGIELAEAKPEEKDTPWHKASVALQFSLIMDPTNHLAREAMQLQA